MTDLFKLILGILASRFKARATLEAEKLVLRQQVNVLRWRTPKRPHLIVLPTIAFQILYCLVIVRHGRRLWVSFGVTANPTAEWMSRQVTEAFPWDHAPRYLIRDRDISYGPVFLQRIRAMAICSDLIYDRHSLVDRTERLVRQHARVE